MYVCMYVCITTQPIFALLALSGSLFFFRLRIFMWPPAASPLPWSRAKNASRPDPYGFYRPRILQHAGVGFAPELAKKKTRC